MENLKQWRSELSWTEAHVVVDPLERFEGQGQSAIIEYAEETIADIDHEMVIESAYLIPSKAGLENLKMQRFLGKRLNFLDHF